MKSVGRFKVTSQGGHRTQEQPIAGNYDHHLASVAKGRMFLLSVKWMEEVGMFKRTYSYRERHSLPEWWLLWPATTRTEKNVRRNTLATLSFHSTIYCCCLPLAEYNLKSKGKKVQVMQSLEVHSLEHNRHKNSRE